MAITTNFNGANLVIPGAYSDIKVQSSNSGLATTGVLMLVGEADAGPSFASEADLELNSFGPDQLADVIAKYGSGPLVDAFRAACAPSTDLPGSFNRAILVKTNASTASTGALGSYSTLTALSEGSAGNLITYSVSSAAAEVSATTGSFTFIPAVDTVNAEIRANGGAALSVSLAASKTGTLNETPTTFKTTVNALSGVTATGGADRSVLTVSGTLALDQNPSGTPGVNNVLITRSIAWATTPVVGDTLTIPTGSVIAGGSDQNVGAYVVIAATSTTVTATKLSDAGKTGAVVATITTPSDVSAASIVAVTEITVFSPVVISVDSGVVDGVGKTLEIAELATGLDLLSRTAFNLSTTAVSWISKSTGAVLLSSATEYKAQLNLARSTDLADEQLAAGGEIALNVSYTGTTATLTVDKTASTLATTVAGGSGASIAALALSAYPTIADLVSFLNSQTGYTASAGSAALGQLPLTALDAGTFGICSKWGSKNGRIKVDAYKLGLKAAESVLVEMSSANAGLPVVQSVAFMSGGTKGGTTAASVVSAIDALENVDGNFLVPLFSQDATADILDSKTESSSTYTIDAINLAAKTHVLKMSTIKKRRNRRAFLSIEGTFTAQKEAATNTASSRCSMSFLNAKQLDSSGNIVQFQPWMNAVLAAAMQAAAFYKSIFRKGINTAGVIHADGSYNPRSDSQVEEALLAGLLPARKSDLGGFQFDSDQTSYTKDNNPVFNSIQAMYIADIVALTSAQKMEQAFIGESLADISASLGLIFMEGLMGQFLTQKLIAPSDDAPKGFKNMSIRLNGPVMLVSCEIKLAGSLYFIPISFLVSQVTQSA